MRHSLPLALVAMMVFSAQAWAQDDEQKDQAAEGDKDKGEGEEGAPTGSLAEGPDPVDTETSDAGPYAPHGATGEKKKTKKKKEKEEKIEAIPRKRLNGYVDVLYLWGTPPDPDRVPQSNAGTGADTGNKGDVSGYGTVVAGMYDLKPNVSLGGRIPFTYTDIKATRLQSQELEGTSMALGNPEFALEYRLDMSPGTFVPLDFGVGIPVAFGDPNPTSQSKGGVARTMANLSVDAATGYHDSELYSVGRVPVAIGGGYNLQRVSWSAYASTKFVTTIKIRGDEPNPPQLAQDGEYSYNPVGIRNITGVGAMADVYKGILIGLDFWLAIDIIRELDFNSDATPPSKLQWVAEPGAGYKFSDAFSLKLSYVAPLSGPLNDVGSIHSLRLRAGLAF